MSGAIRQAMTPAITRLRGYIDEVNPLLEAQERTAEGMDLLRKLLVKVRRTIIRLEDKANQWQDYIRGLPANEQAAEEQIQAAFATGGHHYAEWIDTAYELVADIEILLANESDDGSTQSDQSVELGAGRNRANESRRQQMANENGIRENYAIPSHLPRTRLAEFYGDPLVWPEFWQSFSRTVDNLDIDPGLKAHYLIQSLRGKAKRAVMGYRPIAEHYQPLKDALKRQFGNEKAIRDTLHAELISLPMANESVYSLRSYLEEVERICRSLMAMGRVEDESIVMMAIKNKLPKNIVLELLKKEKEQKLEWDVENLRKGLEEIVVLREEAQRCVQSFSRNIADQNKVRNNWNNINNRNFNSKRNFRKENFERVFTVQSGAGRARNFKKHEISCYLCQGTHHAEKCEKIKPIYLRTKILSEQNRCFLCLKRGHAVANCMLKIDCNICKGRHNKIICPQLYRNEKREKECKKVEKINQIECSDNVLTIMEKTKEVILMQCNMTLINENNNTKSDSVGLFDSGATINFITDEKVKALKLKKVGENELGILPFSHKKPIHINSSRFIVEILLEDGSKEKIVVYKIKREMMPNIKCANLENGRIRTLEKVPDILISIRQFWKFFKGLVPLAENLFEVKTTVGTIICGELGNELNVLSHKKNFVNFPILSISSKEEEMNNFWSLETLGVKDDPISKDDQVAMDFFQKTIKRAPSGRYIVKWPWKEEKDKLPSNFSLAYRRFLGLIERLKRNPELMKEYEKIIENDIKRGVLEDAIRNKGPIEYFLPHHPVITTKKVRIVYDASAKVKGGKSLNELLYRGPIIMPELAGMLIRFRIPEIAIWADIEKAFHCLELDQEDREVLKLIWLKDVRKPISKENIRYLRFSKVPFGVISSPFLLSATVRYHLESMDDPIAKMIKNNSYVDNILISVESKKEAKEAYVSLKNIFKSAQMNLREFISNCKEFNNEIPVEDRLMKNKPKILGIPWDIEIDKILLVFPSIEKNMKVNKRLVLKQLASVFDPLGLASPSLLPAKLFFQNLWEKGKEWDTNLSEEESKEWNNIINNWKVPQIEIERRIINKRESCQLHVFSDASKDAYAACVYIRCSVNEKFFVNILYARNRLKPKKMSVSIPRMELLGVLIAIRAVKFVEDQVGIKIEQKYLWSDSKPVLYWIKENYRGEKFVENRLNEIRSHKEVKFGYVKTKENPADTATRGIFASELAECQLWWKGPEWLDKSENMWPNDLNFEIKSDESYEEENNFEVNQITNEEKSEFIDFDRWSSWNRVIKIFLIVSVILRTWMVKCKKKIKGEFISSLSEHKNLTGGNIIKVEKFLLKLIQKSLDKNLLSKIQSIRDENGLLRLNSRIGLSEMTQEFKNPIILPKGCMAVKLIIEKIHVELMHSGVDSVLGNF
ncbi:Integrase catalytic domain-containing protein [Meloidogyne graminicola]|uniref:Integrase catalytic domain-containing protein n=1 Tax=Meloidogyne graminicola TaxID=189291 RepID=A0A8T0A1W2_9BILA|nr:Integrase catalytic domain-containing protein [Meloidogyne graminicola]